MDKFKLGEIYSYQNHKTRMDLIVYHNKHRVTLIPYIDVSVKILGSVKRYGTIILN